MYEIVHLRGAKHVCRQYGEIDEYEPEERPVNPCAAWLEPERHEPEGHRDDVGVGFGTVTEEYDVACQRCQRLNAEADVLPTAAEDSSGSIPRPP